MITGSTGFIGSYLSQWYSELGHRVFNCNRSTLNLLDAESVKQFFAANYFDLVIHCALVGRESLYVPKQSDTDQLIMDNLSMWENLKNNRHRFRRLINFGTGNEFDTNTNIDYAEEPNIFDCTPTHTYGYVKNLIGRDLQTQEEFYNLRMFGVFRYSESPKRFFRKLRNHSKRDFYILEDRYFDFINLEDITPMIDVIAQGQCHHKDINMVYNEKMLLSNLARQFNEITGTNANIIVNNVIENNYTGDYSRFYSYNTDKLGLYLGFLRY